MFSNPTNKKLNNGRHSNILKFNRTQNELHPTQKPVDMFEFLVLKSSNENDLILDPFLGSETTAVACEKLGRRWVGVEQSEKYCEIAKQRIINENRQVKLF